MALVNSAQNPVYPGFDQYFNDFYIIAKTQDSTGFKLVFHQNQDHLGFVFDQKRPKLSYKDSSSYCDFYNAYVYELQSILRYTHLDIDSIINIKLDGNIDRAKERLKKSLIDSGYDNIYNAYVSDYYKVNEISSSTHIERPEEIHIDSLCRVYAYCFSVLSLHPEPYFHWCSYRGPIKDPQQNFSIVYCEKMRTQQALGVLQQQMAKEMFKRLETLTLNGSEKETKERIEREFRILFNTTPAVKEAIIAFYKNDTQKVLNLTY